MQYNHPHGHLILKHILRDLEYNPNTQYRVHIVATYFWLFNLPFCVALFILFPQQWAAWGIFITLIYSLYANLATDYSGASAALSAMKEPPLPEIPLEVK